MREPVFTAVQTMIELRLYVGVLSFSYLALLKRSQKHHSRLPRAKQTLPKLRLLPVYVKGRQAGDCYRPNVQLKTIEH